MADQSKSILDQIKEQGEVVRKLKAEKAAAEKVQYASLIVRHTP